MSDPDPSSFGKFVPGFDFLQNLAKGASSNIPQMPNLGNWVAPTLNVEELEKRIDELKNVHFWLEQNSRALGATIQALEVQKMTLATLKGMNFNIGDVANALKLKAADSVYTGVQRVTEKAASTAKSISDVALAKACSLRFRCRHGIFTDRTTPSGTVNAHRTHPQAAPLLAFPSRLRTTSPSSWPTVGCSSRRSRGAWGATARAAP